MTLFQTLALLLAASAAASYLNYRFLRLPATIGLMVVALLMSLVLVALGKAGLGDLSQQAAVLVGNVDFSETLLHGMLAFLLFAGALHVRLEDLGSRWAPVALLATLGVVLATLLAGSLFWLAAQALGIDMPFIFALLFGALISPTDPVAVLGILKQVGAPKPLETKITGESLFNDGVGVVVFLTLLAIALEQGDTSPAGVATFLAREVVGGLLLGGLLGWATYRMLARVDAYSVEVLLTLALAAGSYALAEAMHVSAPITVVVAGLLIGNHGRRHAMSERTREHLDTFWELVDEILNAVLFLLIGLEILLLTTTVPGLALGIAAILSVLLARYLSVAVSIGLLRPWQPFSPGAVNILTWGGLRGGISIGLALSLPASPERDWILGATYMVVVFSILVQGLTLRRLINHYREQA